MHEGRLDACDGRLDLAQPREEFGDPEGGECGGPADHFHEGPAYLLEASPVGGE